MVFVVIARVILVLLLAVAVVRDQQHREQRCNEVINECGETKMLARLHR